MTKKNFLRYGKVKGNLVEYLMQIKKKLDPIFRTFFW